MTELLDHISNEALAEYDRLRDDCGRIDLSSWSGFILEGEDRKGWLQGQATNDLRQFTPGTYSAFCICSPTGQLLAVMDVWALQDRFLLTTQHETGPAFLERVRQMVILEEVSVREASDEFQILSIQGPQATRALAGMMTLPSLDGGESRIGEVAVYCTRANRTGLGGWDIWVPKGATSVVEQLENAFPPLSHETFNVARLEAGFPLFGADMNTKTLPPEMGAPFEAKHISYTKGCYTGQEVLMRIHSRGHTNRTWTGLVAQTPLEIGAVLSTEGKPEVGHITSAGFSPDFGYIGAAVLRNEFAREGFRLVARTERGELEAEVRRMPLLRLG